MYVCHAEMNAIMNKISANVEGKLLYTFRYKVWYQIKLSQWYSLYDFAIHFRLFHVCRSFSMQRMYEDDFAVRNQRDRLFQVLL